MKCGVVVGPTQAEDRVELQIMGMIVIEGSPIRPQYQRYENESHHPILPASPSRLRTRPRRGGPELGNGEGYPI